MTSQPVEQRVVAREWRMDALHDLYALGDSNEIIGRVDAMNEHNACVTALRAALAREARLGADYEAMFNKRVEFEGRARSLEQQLGDEQALVAIMQGKAETALADAARLREALQRIADEKPENDYISRVGQYVVTGMSRTEIVQFARAALGQEESPK